MKVFADTKQHKYEYELLEDESGFYLSRDGKRVDVELEALGDGRYSLIYNNMPYIVNLSKKQENMFVRVVGDQFQVLVEDERTRQVKELIKAVGGAHGEKVIKAPIPGLVVKVNAAPGEAFKEGDALLILEAMKMENLIKAPFDCEVLEVGVKEKDAVEQNAMLVKIKGTDA